MKTVIRQKFVSPFLLPRLQVASSKVERLAKTIDRLQIHKFTNFIGNLFGDKQLSLKPKVTCLPAEHFA